MFGDRGAGPYDIEPGQAVAGALLDRLAGVMEVGSAHTLFFLNLYATALTGVVVFGLVRAQGFTQSVSLGAGLLYGFATLAWPHTKYYFRDPLAVMFATVGAWSFEAVFARRTLAGQVGQWAATLALLILAILTKQTTAFIALGVMLAALAHAVTQRAERRAALIGPGLVAVAGLLSLLIPPEGVLGRFSAARYLGLAANIAAQPPSTYLGEALVGALISPGKGLFLESPALVLALVAVPLTTRQQWPRLILPWVTLFSLAVAAPLYRDFIWWGGVGWGVRHILPAAPLLAAACAPVLERLGAARAQPHWRWIAGTLIGVSVIIQVGGASGSLSHYYDALAPVAPGAAWTLAIWDVRYSEAVGYWRTLFDGYPVAFAWVRLLSVRPAWMIGILVLSLISATGLAVVVGWRALRPAARAQGWLALALIVFVGGIAPAAYLRLLRPDPDYVAWREDFRTAAEWVAREAQPGDVVLLRGYLFPNWLYALNYARWPVPWYAFSPLTPNSVEAAAIREQHAPERAFKPDTLALIQDRLLVDHPRLWLINDLGAPAGDQRFEEWWLAERVTPVQSEGDLTRVVLFALTAPQPQDFQSTAVTFGPALQLIEWGVAHGQNVFQPGAVIPLGLRWRAATPIENDYNVGVYLLDASGALVAQRDSQPVNGLRPMPTWVPGEVVTDLHGLRLTEALPAGRYQLALAVYDWRTGERLPAETSGVPIQDALLVLDGITVEQPASP